MSRKMASQQMAFDGSIADMRRQILGENPYHKPGVDRDADAKLAAYDPANSSGSITLSYVGGYREHSDGPHYCLTGNGEISVEREGKRQLVGKLEPDACRAFFLKVLRSGLLNYSEDLVGAKMALARPMPESGVTCAATTNIRISVPELGVEKRIAVYTPEIELKNYPDIIEFKIITELEKAILELVPEKQR